MIILFERFSWIHFFAILPSILKAGGLYVSEGNPLLYDGNEQKLNRTSYILKWFFRLNLRRVGHEDFPKELFKANSGVVGFIESHADKIVNSQMARLLHGLYKDDLVYLAFKKSVMNRISNTFYLSKMAEALAKREEKTVYAVPCERDWLRLFDNSHIVFLCRATYMVGLITDRIRSLYQIFRYVGYIFVGRGGMRGLLLSYLTNSSGKRNIQGKYPCTAKYAIQVTWKFHKGSEMCNGKRKRWDSSFLEDGKEFSGKNLLYVYYRRDVPMVEDVEYHERRGVSYSDEKSLPPTLHYFIRKMIGPALRVAIVFVHEWVKGKAFFDLTEAMVKLLYHIQLYERFTIYYRPKVYLGFDDQGIACIARSIVFKKCGIRTSGIHHSSLGGLFLHPDLAYVSFDKLFTYGKIWRKLFEPYWRDINLDVVGPLRTDLIYESSVDKERHRQFLIKYGNNRKKILVCPAGTGNQNLEERGVDFFKSLQRLLTLRDDILIILRPRGMNKLPKSYREEFIKTGLDSGQIVFEMQEFDTWELIAYCDLIISAQTSSILSEAFAAGKNAFSYAFSGIDEMMSFYSMNPLLVSVSGDELVDRINWFLDHPNAIKNYKNIQQELGQQMDGMVFERIRKGLRMLAEQEKEEYEGCVKKFPSDTR